ncbi:MAG: D-alanyl-D-alanine carboxypeptidase family protein, partial [Parahaliea sp.]
MSSLSIEQLTGVDGSHLVALPGGHHLHPAAVESWQALQRDARAQGFELAIASSHRSFARQGALWNA